MTAKMSNYNLFVLIYSMVFRLMSDNAVRHITYHKRKGRAL